MQPDAEIARADILSMAQKLIRRLVETQGAEVTPALIRDTLAKIRPVLFDAFEIVEEEEILEELIRRWSRTIGRNATLEGGGNHVDWLTAERKSDWRYWTRYAEYLERTLPQKAVDAIDEATDEVLRQLEDPTRPGPWDRRGLVVGHVQSGKTGNYTGLICKAADAGYKIIIVLAGLHNNLRSQTQIRLDEGFLGFESMPNQDVLIATGVGLEDSDPAIRPNNGTNRTESGDFSTAVARGFGVTPEDRPWLFVVKKQKTVLTNLINWIQARVADSTDAATGRKLVTNLPLIVIDDECDHGSVDTGEQEFDENGVPDEEHNPTTINRLIRSLLHSFTRKAYVGYTATPFANIFIHGKAETPEYGPDLFPAAFITSLGAPSNYVGPGRVFRAVQEGVDPPLLRPLVEDDPFSWLPTGHKNGHLPRYRGEEDLPPSLKEAVRSFVFACSVRKLRGQGNKHASMLVHVTRFTSVQGEVVQQVNAYHRFLRDRFSRNVDLATTEAELRDEYENKFRPAMASVREQLVVDEDLEDFSWESVRAVIPQVLEDIKVREINGSAKDALDYVEHKNTGLKVIAIGGDKLARGLTLEGLCTSYFVRTTKMYDTLMQMGRWFGYRDGFLDVCRLYASTEMIEWFGHIAEAAEELRQDFDAMAASGGTPRDFGLKVRSHSVLTVTSRTKMRHAKPMRITFSGDLLQTIVFDPDEKVIKANLAAGDALVAELGTGRDLNDQRYKVPGQTWAGRHWTSVPSDKIVRFLNGYQTHPDSFRVRSDLVARFVETMNAAGELTDWTVALVGNTAAKAEELEQVGGQSVAMLVRKANRSSLDTQRYSIGTLISPRDQAIDLSEAQWNAALELTRKTWSPDVERANGKTRPDTPGGPAIRRILGAGYPDLGVLPSPERGLLLLYLLDPKKSEVPGLSEKQPILAWAVSLPGSGSGRGLSDKDYMANTVEWEGFSDGLG